MRKGRALRSALYLFMCITGSAIAGDVTNPQSALQSAGSCMATAFTANRGQWPDSILFRADVGGAAMWITKTGIYYQFTHRSTEEGPADQFGRPNPSPLADNPARGASKVELIKAEFVGSNPEVSVVGEGELAHKSNFFLGNNPAAWRTDVPNYSSVEFKGLYAGVDLVYSGTKGMMECKIVEAPNADVELLQVRYIGAQEVTVTEAKYLKVRSQAGEFSAKLPVGLLYEPIDDVTIALKAAVIRDVGVTPGTAATGLVYSTYLGGNSPPTGADQGFALAIDDSGNAYVTGKTGSANFPTQNPYWTGDGFSDNAFVAKLDTSGSSLVYATFLGGTSADEGYAIAVDAGGNAYVTGATYSSDFPLMNPFQTNVSGEDRCFVTKLSAAGNSLIYSTRLGGTDGGTTPYAIAVDGLGQAFVAGATSSTNFPTLNPYQPNQPITDAFVVKFSAAGNSLVYGTYLGGSHSDGARGLAIDGSGNAYVTGSTLSADFPTLNAFQGNQDTTDAFVVKLGPAGNSLVYGTYIGGDGSDGASGIAVDGSGSAYIAGSTTSSDFPTQNAFQSDQGSSFDAYAVKLGPAGNSLVYSTYLGGSGADDARTVAVDASGNAYVAGNTSSTDFPTQDPYQTDQIGQDGFVVRLSKTGNALAYGTYLGGSDVDDLRCAVADDYGNVYVAGYTWSTDFPTQNAVQSDQASYDAFVSKIQTVACVVLMTGDVNTNGTITSADIIALVNYVFKSGAAPMPCVAAGDANCSGSVTSADIIALVNFVFKSGAAPCDVCTIVPSLWSCP